MVILNANSHQEGRQMKSNHRRVLFCLTLWQFLLPGCSSLAPSPVGDETRITYTIKDEFNTRSVCTLRFIKGPRGLLEVVVSQQDSVRDPSAQDGKPPGLFDTTEPVVKPDPNGKILTSRFLRRNGGSRLMLTEFGPLWLPPYQLTPGQRFDLGTRFGAAVVDTIITWHGKKLCVVDLGGKQSTISGTSYYGVASGMLFSSRVTNSSTRYYSPDSIATIMFSSSNIPGI
jgi:hypothetical protein